MSNESGKVEISGAFGGEMKYIFILMIACAGVLFGCMFGTVFLLGYKNAMIGLMVGLIGAGSLFFGGWVIIYAMFQIKTAPYHHHLLVVRPENFLFSAFHTEGKTFEEIIDGKPTGWRNKQFILMEPTEFNPEYHQFNIISEYFIHYYGEFSKLSELRQGMSTYRDMEIPHGSTDVLTVEPIVGAYVNVKHGVEAPVFKLIGGRWEGRYYEPTVLIPNPYNNQISLPQQANSKDLALPFYHTEINTSNNSSMPFTDLFSANKRISDLESIVRERERQSQEDKAYAVMHEQRHTLDAGELEGVKDLSGEMHNIVVSSMQHVVTAMNDWYRGLAWMQRNDNKYGDFLKYLVPLIIFFGILAFLGLNQKLLNQAILATQNPLLDLAVIALAVVVILCIYYFVIKRRR